MLENTLTFLTEMFTTLSTKITTELFKKPNNPPINELPPPALMLTFTSVKTVLTLQKSA